MTRDEIVRGEMIKLMIESAVGKGKFMTSADIDMEPAAADIMRQWDWVLALWPDGEKTGALLIRDTGKEGSLRGNSIPCDNKATALKLHALCRAPDNQASELPCVLKT